MKKGNKVQFAEYASKLKSYDAGAVGVVRRTWRMGVNNPDLCHVEWAKEDGSIFHTTGISDKNLVRFKGSKKPAVVEELVELQKGDGILRGSVTSCQRKKIADAFVNAGAEATDSYPYPSDNNQGCYLIWDASDNKTYGLAGINKVSRQLTYNQIINATNAKPKPVLEELPMIETEDKACRYEQRTAGQPKVGVVEPMQSSLEDCLLELSQIAVRKVELEKLITDKMSSHGASVSFGEVELTGQLVEQVLDVTEIRDLKLGDVIQIARDNSVMVGLTIGDLYKVTDTFYGDTYFAVKNDAGRSQNVFGDVTKWRFISRP